MWSPCIHSSDIIRRSRISLKSFCTYSHSNCIQSGCAILNERDSKLNEWPKFQILYDFRSHAHFKMLIRWDRCMAWCSHGFVYMICENHKMQAKSSTWNPTALMLKSHDYMIRLQRDEKKEPYRWYTMRALRQIQKIELFADIIQLK